MAKTEEAKTYRELLQRLEEEAQRSYDKTVLTLSGGALGISFAFLKDIIGVTPTRWHAALFVSWTSWGLSVTAILLSFLFSNEALRKAIEQLDNCQDRVNPYDKITAILNVLGGLLFFVGVIAMVIFAVGNMR